MNQGFYRDRAREAMGAFCRYMLAALKWTAAACGLGGICGLLGAGFHEAIDLATNFRMNHGFIIWFLPAAGLITLLLYQLCRVSFGAGTNLIIQSVTTNEHIPAFLAPLIVAGTLLSHLFGASVGREGAALQLGGSIGHNLAELLRFDEDDVRTVSMCGMAACFSAMFGTPLTAAIFVLEVITVGSLHYGAFLPCVLASYTAAAVSRALGIQPMSYALTGGALRAGCDSAVLHPAPSLPAGGKAGEERLSAHSGGRLGYGRAGKLAGPYRFCGGWGAHDSAGRGWHSGALGLFS